MLRYKRIAAFAILSMVLNCILYFAFAEITLTSQQIVDHANNLLGSSFTSGYCLEWIATKYWQSLGAPYSSDCCAHAHGMKRLASTSRDNIPIGANVYFFSGSTVAHNGNLGYYHNCGHIGVYVGNNSIVSLVHYKNDPKGVAYVRKNTIDEWIGWGYGFSGWGYPDGVKLDDKPIPIGDSWTYRVATSDGLNMRSSASTNGGYVTTLWSPTEINVTKKTSADGYTWGYGTSSTGYTGWIVVDNSWTTLVSSTVAQSAYLDVNGWLDATFSGNLGDCGTVDVYINGELVANDVNDYYTAWPVGTTYEISDIRARQGYIYRGAHISYLSGKIDSSGTDVELSFDRDGILPTISNVAVANITSEGYTVTCTVTDNIGIEKVQFPTWYEGQQGEDAIWHDGIITGNTATCTINVSDHGGKTGLNYHTDVYAWDVAGNRSIGANARYNYVPNPTVIISGISLDKYKLTMDVGTTYALDASVYPVNATNKSLFWATNNSSACVVNDGVIKAEGEGDAIITCAANDGSGVYVECRVSVNPVFANTVMLNRSVFEFSNSTEGGLELTATLSPDNASNKSMSWASSNTGVATVENGIVTPVSAGYARITCEAAGGAKGVCDIVVHADKIKRLPKSLKTIEAETFYGTSLREVIVPEGVTSIDSKAFGNCGKLALINLPASVKIIASDAFSGSNVAFMCENTCYATEYADVKGIPYIIGSMPREVVISAEKTTVMPGQSVNLQGSVLPANAPKAIRWSIVEGSDIATISGNGNKCVLSANATGHVTVAATAINSAKGTIDISIIEHPTNFEIWFDGNGGNVDTNRKTAEFDVAIGSLPTATRDYYTFDGWYTQANGGTQVTKDDVFSDYFIGDITLYAHWTRKTCTITFNANGGSCGTLSKTMDCGGSIGSLPTPSRTYYTSDGWYTAASGGSKVANSTAFTEDTTLYAHWTLNGFGSWSAWSTISVTGNENRQVETKTEQVQTGTNTKYNYKRYLYWNPTYSCYYSTYGDTWARNKGYSGSWQYMTSSSPLPVAGNTDGYTKYTGERRDGNAIWWYEEVVSEAVYSSVTYYHYRDRIQ